MLFPKDSGDTFVNEDSATNIENQQSLNDSEIRTESNMDSKLNGPETGDSSPNDPAPFSDAGDPHKRTLEDGVQQDG